MSLLDASGRATIVCDDTLSRRLDIAFENLAHVARAALFGKGRGLVDFAEPPARAHDDEEDLLGKPHS